MISIHAETQTEQMQMGCWGMCHLWGNETWRKKQWMALDLEAWKIHMTNTENGWTHNKCGKLRKDKNLQACLEEQQPVRPNRQIASALSHQWSRQYFKMLGFVKTWMAHAVLRYHSFSETTLLVPGIHLFTMINVYPRGGMMSLERKVLKLKKRW